MATITGCEARRGVIAQDLIDDAHRLLHLDLLERGASAQELSEWLWGAHWFPHTGPVPELTFHLDQEPAWAHGKRYRRIVGVPLSRWHRANGGLLVKAGDDVTAVELEPGDAVAMAPDLLHSGGINTTGSLRYGVYFRWLQ